jgi:hypothetical protein
METYRFTAALYLWESRVESWVFANLPPDISDEIDDALTGPRRGFGAVKVEVAVGGSRWHTSIFPSKSEQTFVLPVKRAILKVENLTVGDSASFELRVIPV